MLVPTERVAEPRVTEPLPVNPPTELLKLAMERVAPLEIPTTELVLRAFVEEACSVEPAARSVGPLKLLLPVSVSVLDAATSTPPVPLIAPP